MNKRKIESYPDVMTPTECMELLQIGRNTIYKLLNDGILPALKLGRQYRIPKKSLLSYLDSCYSDCSVINGSVSLR